MKILSIIQKQTMLFIKVCEEEGDVQNSIFVSFNDEKNECVPDDNGIIEIDMNKYIPKENEKNVCTFYYLVNSIDVETGESFVCEKSLSLRNYEGQAYPQLKIVKKDDYYIKPFFTKKKNLRVHYGTNPKFHGKQYLEFVRGKKDDTKLSITLNTEKYPVKDVQLILLARENLEELKIPVKSLNKISKSIDRFKYRIKFEILWSNYELYDDIYDAYIEVEYDCASEFPELKKRLRVGKTRYIQRKLVKDQYIEKGDYVVGINPYFTDKYNNLSFSIQNIPLETYNVLKKEKVKQSDVIIIGERPYKAQDTGFALFKQLRQNHPELPVYYVIQYDSPEFKNVEPYGNTVDFGSPEHARLMLQAKTLFCSHHFYYLLPFRHEGLEKRIKARKIFIQHGVLGVKYMDIYDRSVKRFDPDLFVVSSEYEKEMVMRCLHYEKEEVKVTGLSRFDTLFDGKNELKNQIVVIPTWRDWISGKEKFLESQYFDYYHQLINDEELNKKLMENDTKLVFCLHPNMQRFTPFFTSKFENVQIISQGEVNVQDIIKESKMMITDYSSVAFDFSFLEKPVVYFQFDRNRFLGKQGSFIDLDKNLPGKITFTYENLLEQVFNIIDNNYIVDEDVKKRTNQFLAYKDLNNSQRILELADIELKQKKIKKWYKQNEFFPCLYSYIRRSKFYFPVAKLVYPMLKLLPLKENTIVFESGVGRQVSDAPREIYDKLVETDKGKYKKVWAYNGTKPMTDKNTKVVKRLSPAYYYYLATSKYWVNNQSFPYYVTARKNTKYLQTWHGTPLKRMLFDLDEIHGRDEGYVDRVTQAKNQWTTLLAQSDYAEEKFKSAFNYSQEVLKVGYPRNDVLFRDTKEQEERLKAMLNISEEKKVILYAPTFRDDAEKKGNKFAVDLKIDFENFINKLGEDYVLLLRFHVIASGKVKIPLEYSDRIKNVSNYPEIQDLYKISECLITDYSSVFFDYMNLKRPMIFYAYDLENYEQNLRGFYLNYEENVPGPIVKEEDELYEYLGDLEKLKSDYSVKMDKMLEKFAPKDDENSAQRVIEHFFD